MKISRKMREFYRILGSVFDYDTLEKAEAWFNAEMVKGTLTADDVHDMQMTLAFGRMQHG